MAALVFGVRGLTCADCAARLERALRRDAGVRDVAVSLMAGTATVTTKDSGADDGATQALAQRLVAVAAPLGFPLTLQANRDAASLTLDVLAASQGATLAALVALRGVRKVESAGAHGALHTAVTVKYDPAAVGARRLLAACPPGARAAACTHVADTAELHRHRLRLAAAALLTVATIVLQYGIPRGVGAYDAAFSGVLTARMLVLWTLATAAGAVFGWPLLRAAAAAAWYSRTMTMDTLVSTSSGVAYVYAVALIVASWAGRSVEGLGEPPFETVSILLGLVAVGREIEATAKRQTARALEGLARLQRIDAVLVQPGATAHEAVIDSRLLIPCCQSRPELAVIAVPVCRRGIDGACSACRVGCCKPGESVIGCSAACIAVACCDVVVVRGCTLEKIRSSARALLGSIARETASGARDSLVVVCGAACDTEAVVAADRPRGVVAPGDRRCGGSGGKRTIGTDCGGGSGDGGGGGGGGGECGGGCASGGGGECGGGDGGGSCTAGRSDADSCATSGSDADNGGAGGKGCCGGGGAECGGGGNGVRCSASGGGTATRPPCHGEGGGGDDDACSITVPYALAASPAAEQSARAAAAVVPSAASPERHTRIAPELLHLGDVVLVGPGQQFPADGVVALGTTVANESIVTGEQRPVPKEVGSTVIGGSTNGDGLVHVRVAALPSMGTVSRIISLIESAQAQRPRSQQTADIISAWFTPFVLVAGAASFVAWLSAASTGRVDTGGLSPVAFALQFALSLIVVSCPCAVGLAVPTAVMVATSVAARHGLLLKSGVALESMVRASCIIFDKTGTLTTGKAAVQKVAAANPEAVAATARRLGIMRADVTTIDLVLAVAATVAEGSSHPLSMAIVAHARACGLHAIAGPAAQRTAVAGKGIRATINGVAVLVGSPAFLERDGGIVGAAQEAERLAGCDTSLVCIAVDGAMWAVISLVDAVRPEAGAVVRAFSSSGLQVWIASGDAPGAVAAVAAAVGIPNERARSGLSPEAKAALVAQLQDGGHTQVIMVGDGINDAVALTAADVGIAMGAGTSVAMDCADIVVKSDSLASLLTLADLARTTRRRILANFGWAGIYNVVAMPLAAGALFPAVGKVVIPPAFAGLSELLSSVPVVLGSLLLYRFTAATAA